jgi:hypothetical protein
MRNARRRFGVPLYDVKGNFLEYITHEAGIAMVNSGGADAIREFKDGRERVKCYRETQSRVRSNLGSLFSN